MIRFIRKQALPGGAAILAAAWVAGAIATPRAANLTLTVQAGKPGARIPATEFGLFFEDINFGADGGLYPERIKNRSFEFPDALMGWSEVRRGGAKGALHVVSEGGVPNARYLRIAAESAGIGVSNEGFRGVAVEAGAEYEVTFRSRGVARLRLEVEGTGGQPVAEADLPVRSTRWKDQRAVVRAASTEPKGRFLLLLDGSGTVDVDDISVYPRSAIVKGRRGLRPDLVKLLKEMKPGFLRFPGGCIVEGRTLALRYQWKATIGDPRQRRPLVNRWNDVFRHRPTPDYYQSFGLGFFEYFQLCEELGAEPLPVLNCGMACQFQSSELAPLGSLDPYVQDALDLIEFANGPVTSPWGAKRAAMGHPSPFKMKLIGVGNEQWGPQYFERYEVFQKELRARHPEIEIISGSGPSPDGARFNDAWKRLRELKADIVDEHYYAPPKWFRENAGRYDSYPRTGPKVFAGEYAAQSVGIASPNNRNNWECALSEAAFLTGLERNADVVVMASYAPLFAHVDAWQWTPNLIWFDNLRSVGTASYQVQKLFSANRGSAVLPAAWSGGANGTDGCYASATLDSAGKEVIVKLVNTNPVAKSVGIDLPGASRVGAARATTLAEDDLSAENTLERPNRILPAALRIRAMRKSAELTMPAHSVTLVRIGLMPE